jgi:hypothetical protein
LVHEGIIQPRQLLLAKKEAIRIFDHAGIDLVCRLGESGSTRAEHSVNRVVRGVNHSVSLLGDSATTTSVFSSDFSLARFLPSLPRPIKGRIRKRVHSTCCPPVLVSAARAG